MRRLTREEANEALLPFERAIAELEKQYGHVHVMVCLAVDFEGTEGIMSRLSCADQDFPAEVAERIYERIAADDDRPPSSLPN
jgi:hypothetical protein